MGDPAYYKYKDIKSNIKTKEVRLGTKYDAKWAKDNNFVILDEDLEDYNKGLPVTAINATGVMLVKYTTNLGDNLSITKTIPISNLNEKDSDKTKRLGAGLSPGSEMRL